MQNSDAWTAQLNPMPSVPLPQDYVRGDRESPPKAESTANAWVSFSSFASEIACAMVAWQRAISPRCQSDRASNIRQMDGGRVDLFDRRLYASRAPDLETTPRVLSRSLEIAQKVERDCQSVVGPYH